jgi:glyoxylase-like metal-dependent hydrolase (beta-lactamase superfamily II)
MATTQMDLDYPYARPADVLDAPEVAPGIHWLRFDTVGGALGHVNAYALNHQDGWALIDTGIGNEATRALWRQFLAGPLGGRPIRHLVCTHGHIDHTGQAVWLQEMSGAPLSMTLAEWQLAADPGGHLATSAGDMREFYRHAGLDEAALSGILSGRPLRRAGLAEAKLEIIKGGEVLRFGGRDWRIIIGHGHSPEHACLYDEAGNVLIAGDQILPAISPNVSVFPREPEADPLAGFLASLEHLMELPEDVLVLPGHGLPFRGLHRRARALKEHHRERLDDLVAALATPEPCSAMLPVLFRRALSGLNLMLGVGEALAHLNHLMVEGRVTRLRAPTGPDLYLRAG